jgi:hypothetical protein
MNNPTNERICFVCNKPIVGKDLDDRHECHAPGCRRNNCECDYPAHAKCCPNCNKKTGVRY